MSANLTLLARHGQGTNTRNADTVNQLLTMSAQLHPLIADCARNRWDRVDWAFQACVPGMLRSKSRHSFIPEGVEARMYEMADHMMKMLMSIMAAMSLGSLLFLMAVI
ncbi:hypothetical protein [Ensifer sp.]|uniref:hypothetical protein n=1 Tax=Ensifer sp. TaxID=1872086 RepID=UPI0028A091DC|nr:hypothetical protein [Ensifer sp.]